MWCGNTPYAGRFKLSILGVLASLCLALLGILPRFKDFTVEFPLAWILALFLLLPSLVLYYSVKDKFWAAVAKEGRGGSSA